MSPEDEQRFAHFVNRLIAVERKLAEVIEAGKVKAPASPPAK